MATSILTNADSKPAIGAGRRYDQRLWAAVLVVLLLSVPLLLSGYNTALITEVLIFAIFAMSLDLLIGYTGLLSFGHAAFFGLGAYAVIVLNVALGLNAWGGLAAAVLLAAAAAAAIGALCIRVSGIPFLMLTMAFSQLLFSVAVQWRDVTGGTDGIGGLAKPTLAGYSIEDRTVFYYVAAVFFIFSFWALRRLVAAPLGSVFVGIRENEPRMRALGYDVQRYKLLSFIIAGAFAGLAGGLYALFNGFISSDALHWSMSGDVIIMAILGGTGTIIGPVLGTAIFLLLRNVASSYTEHWMTVIGVVFIACVMFLPQGIWGWLKQAVSRRGGARR